MSAVQVFPVKLGSRLSRIPGELRFGWKRSCRCGIRPARTNKHLSQTRTNAEEHASGCRHNRVVQELQSYLCCSGGVSTGRRRGRRGRSGCTHRELLRAGGRSGRSAALVRSLRKRAQSTSKRRWRCPRSSSALPLLEVLLELRSRCRITSVRERAA